MSQTIIRQRSFTSLDNSVTKENVLHEYSSNHLRKSQLIDDVNNILTTQQISRKSILWCCINLVLAILSYYSLFESVMLYYFGWKHKLFEYIDSLLLIVFSWNLILHMYRFCLPVLKKQQVLLSDKQKQLLGIDEKHEKYFSPKRTSRSSRSDSNVFWTPSSISQSTYPTSRSPSRTTPNSYLIDQSPNYGQYSPSRAPRYSPQNNPNATNSWTSTPGSPFGARYSPIQDSSLNTSQRLSYSNTSPPVFMNNSRNQSPSLRLAQFSPSRKSIIEEQILDEESLEKFMKKEEKSELKQRRSHQDSQQSSSFWSYGRSAYEYIPSITTYQLATRSPVQNRQEDDENGTDSPFKNDEIWRKLGLRESDVKSWTENIRKWLGQTVLEPLVKEIDNINDRLTQLGNPELHIGSISHSALQTLANTKAQHLPSLTSLLPYLDISTNQEYLLSRLKELSTGGCLRLYKWNSGGKYKNKAWSTDLPTDAQIICHLFCTYMDTHLPSNPRHKEGKTFTGLHFLKTPSKIEDKKSALCIYQTRTQNPHFQVLVEDNICDIPKGRNNLFYSIVLFLYFADQNYYGMLERVNLGMSGINVLWVLNK